VPEGFAPLKDVEVGRVTTRWLELVSESGEYRSNSVPTGDLQEIAVKRHGLGAAEGLGIGIATGLLSGVVSGAKIAQGSRCNDDGRCLAIVVLPIVGVVFGSLFGAMFGATIGHRTTIEFDSDGSTGTALEPSRIGPAETKGDPGPAGPKADSPQPTL
jgi:hypothetical protein